MRDAFPSAMATVRFRTIRFSCDGLFDASLHARLIEERALFSWRVLDFWTPPCRL